MEEYAKIAILLDFYGQLLTQRQFQILDLYYNSDYSLGEISTQLNISRQGVYDGVKKGKTALKGFEEKLGLVKRFLRHEESLKDILLNLRKIQKVQGEDLKLINMSIEELEKIIKDL